MRRDLELEGFDSVLGECRSLLGNGYQRAGNWSLGQICRHIRLTIEANMNGYPWWMTLLGFPLRPILKLLLLPRIMSGRSPAGLQTAPSLVPPDGLDDDQEFQAFESCVGSFVRHTGPLYPHPAFGKMSHEEFGKFHVAHCIHHLRFLIPKSDEG
ncbi:MAG: DUF1569 domain-containing protein [Planctomycetota bacterium]